MLILLNSAWNIYQERYIVPHKTSLNNLLKFEAISSIFYDYNAIKLEIKTRGTFKNV
jgi:hypothetical protein